MIRQRALNDEGTPVARGPSMLRAHKLAASSRIIPARTPTGSTVYCSPSPPKDDKKKNKTRTVSPAANRAASSTNERTNSSAVRACVREASWARGLHAQLVLILPWEAHRTTTSSARVGTIRDMFPATEPILLHRSKPGGEGRDFFLSFF